MDFIKRFLFFVVSISFSNSLVAMDQPPVSDQETQATQEVVVAAQQQHVTPQMVHALIELADMAKTAEKIFVD